ncbi:MAG: penicillin-binding protein, partial [Ruminococcaceae bacterium]|nr:penicillin-binding protein [Oscillospiraceae bacterium]
MAQTKAKKHTVLHAIGRAFLTVFLILVITGCIVGTVFAIYILQYVNIDPGVDIRNIKLNYTSIIWATDANGENYELKRLHSEENRIWVDIDQMPVHLQKAAIAAEDKRFEYHHGVDWKRTIYSAINEVLHLSKRQGGST